MTTVLVVGILTAFVATTVAAGVRRAPTRVQCPRCGGKTEMALLPPFLQRAAPELRARWCPACSWEGMGRQGAEMIPGKPAAHGSGFRWGRERFPEDFGFRFAEAPQIDATSDEPPAHPSGFRFAERPAPEERAHPSGFIWADGDAANGGRSGTDAQPAPVVFRWAEPMQAPVFRWRSPAESRPTFRWKD